MIFKHNRANVIMAVVMMSIFLICFCDQVQAEVEGPWEYEVTNGEAHIFVYNNVDAAQEVDVIIPNSLRGYPVKSITDYCFFHIRGAVTSIEIPDSITELNRFNFLLALEKINIPQNVTKINDETFWDCSRLSSIEIPESVTSIGERAFLDCTALIVVFNGQGINSIGEQAFRGCSSLLGFLIPEGVTTIGYQTFAYCTSMRDISIPKGITSIGKEAFYQSGLNTITFNSRETEIYESKDTIPEETKIIGHPSSTAEEYAKKYNRVFQDINDTGDKSSYDFVEKMSFAIVLLGFTCLGLGIIVVMLAKKNKELLKNKTVESEESVV